VYNFYGTKVIKLVKTAIAKYLDGEINAQEYLRLTYLEEHGIQKSAPVEVLKSDDPDLIAKACSREPGAEEAYFEYGRRVSAEKALAKQQARAELVLIEKEFNRQLDALISKNDMTDEQKEALVWGRNENDVTLRYQRATRTLEMD
jgi:hypothetical protein